MSQYAFNKPVFGPAIESNPFGVTFYVSNTTNPTEDQGSPGPTASGRSPKNPYGTIAAAVAATVSGRGDTIVIQRGTYTENVTITQNGLTLKSASGEGYPDHVVITGRTIVTASNCTFIGIEFFSNSATLPSVTVGSQGGTDRNSTAFLGCSFASDGSTEPLVGLKMFGGNNYRIRGCNFIDNGSGIVFEGSADSFPSNIQIRDSLFMENTTAHVRTSTVALDGTGPGSFENLTMVNCVLNRGAVTPTDQVNLAGGNGIIANCMFAEVTNNSGNIVIPTGVLFVANGTEAGISTARPA